MLGISCVGSQSALYAGLTAVPYFMSALVKKIVGREQ